MPDNFRRCRDRSSISSHTVSIPQPAYPRHSPISAYRPTPPALGSLTPAPCVPFPPPPPRTPLSRTLRYWPMNNTTQIQHSHNHSNWPACIGVEEASKILGWPPYFFPILVRTGHLKPLGKPMQN